jgi:Family of unknown function (DUF6406)
MHSKNLIDEVSITESTVAQIDGVSVAASAIYEDDEGEPLVDLRVAKRAHDELMEGDRIPIGDQTWTVVAFVLAKGNNKKGSIVLRRA